MNNFKWIILFLECSEKDQNNELIFSAIWICIKNQNLKNEKNEDDIGLFLNRPSFMWNRIIIPMLLIIAFCFKSLIKKYIFQFTRYEHRGVSKSIDSDDRNFSFIGLVELLFLNPQHCEGTCGLWIVAWGLAFEGASSWC